MCPKFDTCTGVWPQSFKQLHCTQHWQSGCFHLILFNGSKLLWACLVQSFIQSVHGQSVWSNTLSTYRLTVLHSENIATVFSLLSSLIKKRPRPFSRSFVEVMWGKSCCWIVLHVLLFCWPWFYTCNIGLESHNWKTKPKKIIFLCSPEIDLAFLEKKGLDGR